MFDYVCDQIWVAPDGYYVDDLIILLKGIIKHNRTIIRESFADGYTPYIAPGWDDDIKEIRITHEGELFMVICGDEISF